MSVKHYHCADAQQTALVVFPLKAAVLQSCRPAASFHSQEVLTQCYSTPRGPQRALGTE